MLNTKIVLETRNKEMQFPGLFMSAHDGKIWLFDKNKKGVLVWHTSQVAVIGDQIEYDSKIYSQFIGEILLTQD